VKITKKRSLIGGIFFMSIILLTSTAFQSSHAAPGTGTLFGTDGNNANVITVNTVSGVGNVIGPNLQGTLPSLAFDHTTNTMFGGTGGGIGALHTVNTITGQANPVGVSNLGFAAVGGMDVASDGTIFAAVNIAGDGGTGSDHLATIDKNTGLFTIIGPFGTCDVDGDGGFGDIYNIPGDSGGGVCTNEGIEGIAFDALGNLWGVHSARGAAAAPGLYTINTVTGAAAFAVPLLDVAGAAASGGFVSIQYTCDGTLFGGTASDFGAPDGGFLATINPNTGQFTLAPNGATLNDRSLAGLAFDTLCLKQGVGGEYFTLDTTALLVAGMQTNLAWIIPVAVSTVGIGAFLLRKKF